MRNEKISAFQVINMMVLFILGSTMVTGGDMGAYQDSWVSLLLAMLMALAVVSIYARLKKLGPEQDLFDLSYTVFGKIGGAIITFLFSIYVFHLGSMVIRNFTEYIQVVSLPETPQVVNAISIGLIAFFTIKAGIAILGRGTVLVLPIVAFIVLSSILFSINHMDLSNIKPILYQDPKTIFSGAFSMFAFPFAETVVFISVFPSVKNKKKFYPVYLTAILISGFLLLVLLLRNIFVLGFPLIKSLYFPSYSAVATIEVGSFLSRIEVLVSGNFIISGLVKVTVCLYVACKGFAKLLNIDDHKKLAAPLSFLMVVASGLLYKNTMQMFAFVRIYKYYAPFFQVIIPLIILIFAEIKAKRDFKMM